MRGESRGGAFENRSQFHAFHSESEVRDLGRPLFAPLTPRCARTEKPAVVSAASCRESTASERGDPVLRGFVYKIYKCSCVACSVCHSFLVSCLDTHVSCVSFLVSNGVSCRRCHGQLLLGCRTTWARKKSLTGSEVREGLMVESASNDPCLGIPREPEFLDGEICCA